MVGAFLLRKGVAITAIKLKHHASGSRKIIYLKKLFVIGMVFHHYMYYNIISTT